MRFLLLAFVFSVFSLSHGYGPQPRCHHATIAVNITAHPRVISLAPPTNQSELTGIIANFTSMHSNFTVDNVQGQRTLTATYKIWTLLCLPSEGKPNIVEFAIHGYFLLSMLLAFIFLITDLVCRINFDHSYWNFGGAGSSYNYVDVALKAGHAIFIYDRLGTSKCYTSLSSWLIVFRGRQVLQTRRYQRSAGRHRN